MSTRDITPLSRLERTRTEDDHHDAHRDEHPDNVRSGFPSLDRALSGGFRRGDLIVLGGDDGVGTSALALGIALRRATPALLLSGEMSAERVYERALAISARVSIESMRLGTLTDDERSRLASTAVALRGSAPAVALLTPRGVADIVRALDSMPDASLVFVDGVEALLDHGERRDESLAYLVLSLKRLAIERRVALVLVTHLSAMDRQRADRRPRLTDFGMHGAVGTHADVVLGLYREDLYDNDLGVAGATELIVLKQRGGARGYVDLYYTARWLRFEDVLDPER